MKKVAGLGFTLSREGSGMASDPYEFFAERYYWMTKKIRSEKHSSGSSYGSTTSFMCSIVHAEPTLA